MRLLDLFCGAGGASMGYYLAGFDEIVGVDIAPMPRYPFDFVMGDALDYCKQHGREFDIIHASPPCQAYSVTKSLSRKDHPDLVALTRQVLLETGKPFVIENVPGAPLINPLMLCGTMFGLRVIRHRLFETYPYTIWFPPASCRHDGRVSGSVRYDGRRRDLENFDYLTVTGYNYVADYGRRAMGIEWMTMEELSQAVPPAYTRYIGEQIIQFMTKDNGST